MTKLTSKYQITIPPSVRKALHLIPGTDIDITKLGNNYVLRVNGIQRIKDKWRGKYKSMETSDHYLNRLRGEI
jgi:AbrB family looped-hinge helix DNA binding protein